MVNAVTTGSEPRRCPVCDGEVTFPDASRPTANGDLEASKGIAARETQCSRCLCALSLGDNDELLIEMSKTSAQRIAAELAEWRTSGAQELLLDFQHMPFLRSEFLNELILLQQDQRCRPVLCNLAPEVEELFQITQLNRVFNIRARNE